MANEHPIATPAPAGQPQPIDYSNPLHCYASPPARYRFPWSLTVAIITAAVAGPAVMVGSRGGGVFAVPVIWLAGGLYCALRVAESRALSISKGWMGATSVVAVMAAPFVLCHRGDAPPVMRDIMVYGWNSRHVTTLHRFICGMIVICLIIFTLVQVIDWLGRKYITYAERPEKPAATVADKSQLVHVIASAVRFDFEPCLAATRWKVWGPIALFIFAGAAALRYGVPAYVQMQRPGQVRQSISAQFQAQAACMNYTQPLTTIAYTDDPAVMQSLTGTHGGYSNGRTLGSVLPEPACWRAFVQQGPGESSVYLHGMSAPDGSPRLLEIGVGGYAASRLYQDNSDDRIICLYERMFIPGSATAPAKDITVSRAILWPSPHTWSRLDFRLKDDDVITIYAGQPDPADPTHLTIDYAINGVRDTIDGRLTNSRLILTPRQPSKLDSRLVSPPGD